MSMGITKLFEDAEHFVDHKRFPPAIAAWDEARRLTKFPERRAWATYNIGTVFWHHLGDGVAARREFLGCIADFEAHGYGAHEMLKLVHANALENAMLCALSFDEFDSLAERLGAITTEPPILAGLVPEVHKRRDRGEPWSNQMLDIARRYYSRNDPKMDAGRYGEARSTYHLILTHRRELRLSRSDWRLALFEFCALSMRMTSDCGTARGGDNDPDPVDEYLPILTEAVPAADEYLTANSGDDDMRKTRADMAKMLDGLRDRRGPARRPGSSDMPSPNGCAPVLLLLALLPGLAALFLC